MIADDTMTPTGAEVVHIVYPMDKKPPVGGMEFSIKREFL
jgi:hypothetical protein